MKHPFADSTARNIKSQITQLWVVITVTCLCVKSA